MQTATSEQQQVHFIDIVREQQIAAPVEIVWESILDQIGPMSEMPGGAPFPMKFEAWPGGRWYRDLGDQTGHLWGHVQVIKPNKLLEICGPMFMSYPAISHLQYRLVAEAGGTHLKLTHKAMGLIPLADREGVVEGWEYILQKISELAQKRASK